MNIALTGATGFVGRRMAHHFAGKGHRVTAWLRPASSPDRLGQNIDRIVSGSLDTPETAMDLCHDQDAVVHCGWWTPGPSFTTPPPNAVAYYQTNVIGSMELIQAARQCGVSRFIFISTGAVHGKTLEGDLDETHPLWPTSVYGSAKAAIETVIHAEASRDDDSPLAACTLRPTSVYGVDDPVDRSRFYELIRRVLKGEEVSVQGGGKLVHVDDLCSAAECLLAAHRTAIAGETFNCTGGFLDQRTVAERTAQMYGRNSRIIGQSSTAGKIMRTGKIESLGMTFDQDVRLRQTIAGIAAHLGFEPRSAPPKP